MVTNRICTNCQAKATISLSYLDRHYCTKCFSEMIEKRVRKDIRINKKAGKEKEISLFNDKSKEFCVAKYILESVFSKSKVLKLVKKVGNKTFVATNLDREVKSKLEEYLKGKKKKDIKGAKILNNVTEEEIIQFCKIKNFKIGKKESKNNLIEGIENKYPGTKFALGKSFTRIEKLSEKKQ